MPKRHEISVRAYYTEKIEIKRGKIWGENGPIVPGPRLRRDARILDPGL